MSKVSEGLQKLVVLTFGVAVLCGPQSGECAIDANKVSSLQIAPGGGVVPVPAGGVGNITLPDNADFVSDIANEVVDALIGPINESEVDANSTLAEKDKALSDALAHATQFFVMDDGFIIENNDGLGLAAFVGMSLEEAGRDFPLSDDNRDKVLEALLDGIPPGGIEDLDQQELLEVALLLGQNFGDKQLEGEPSLRKAAIDRLKQEVVREFNRRQRRTFAKDLQELLGPPSDQQALARAVRMQELLNRRPKIWSGLFGIGNNANKNGVGGLAPEADDFDVMKNDSYVNAATIPQMPAGGGQTFFGPFILNPGVNGASINVNEVIYNFYFNGSNIVTVP